MSLVILAGSGGDSAAACPRLEAVRSFADNVLTAGRIREDVPLLADGINLDTGEPAEWVYRGGRGPDGEWVIHNLASQQNLFRIFVALSNLTGEQKYRQAAVDAFKYHFEHLRADCGLLRWGGHQIIDLRTLEPIGHFDNDCHEFKNNFPFYELMWEIDREATVQFLRAFWNAHVMDWGKLDMSRHGPYDKPMGKLWESEYKEPDPFFEARGLTFINCGSDLIYAGTMLYSLNDEEGALKWARRLSKQYVRARHPETGLGVYQYSKPLRIHQPPETGPLNTISSYGDRAENQFGADFPDVAREGWVLFHGGIYVVPALIQLEIAERLGDEGRFFLETTIDGLKAYAKHAYNPETNEFKPMWADGTDLTGYKFPRSGYYGPKGRVLQPSEAHSGYLFSYARAYRLSRDRDLWEVVRSIGRGLGLGDFGDGCGQGAELNMKTKSSDPHVIFALLEIARACGSDVYLDLADVVADNMMARSFHRGFFLKSENHLFARFDDIEPLALLKLEATRRGQAELVPSYSYGAGYIHGSFDGHGRTRDTRVIWNRLRD